ncbi:hypothetical protein PALB_20890 [Pseudoalteromonas luteoviolacea B = ATCC 29581]|nr:hypothetical protein PALB_20890 [Pseudoalteromonas luteoviolacea B = ATCC 29581]
MKLGSDNKIKQLGYGQSQAADQGLSNNNNLTMAIYLQRCAL